MKTRLCFAAASACVAWLASITAHGAANPQPLNPDGDGEGLEVVFQWTTEEPGVPLSYDVHVEPTGNALLDGTVAPLLPAPFDTTLACEPCASSDPNQCFGFEGTCFCTTTGICTTTIEGVFAGQPSRTELFADDGDEYCWKVRESGTSTYSGELCFLNGPGLVPNVPVPLSPAHSGAGPAILPNAPVTFDWTRAPGAFADTVSVFTALQGPTDYFCEEELSAVAPGAQCDGLEVGRIYYWRVAGFSNCEGLRCYGSAAGGIPNSFVLRECGAADCDGDLSVSVAELTRAVAIALGNRPLGSCPAADPDGDGSVSVANLVAGVDAALSGCSS